MRAHATCVAAAALLLPTVAHAHAPLVRDLALAPDGEGMVVRMPGFGWLVRRTEAEPFAYLCDALLGIEPFDPEPPFAYRADGAWLVGTASGLRVVGFDGCPRSAEPELATRSILALAAHPDDPDLVYAVTADEAAVQRSDDGGSSWTVRAALTEDGPVTALVPVPGELDSLYVVQSPPTGGTVVSRSVDGGASFEAWAHERKVFVVAADRAPARGLWARASVEPPPGVVLLRADEPAGPWREALHLAFFGGFALEDAAAGAVAWAGDEGGGVFRSQDGGDGFDEVRPETAVACLHHGRDALWACMPGLPSQPAVATSSGPDAMFEPVVTLAEVDRLVACEPALAVEQVCAAAWREWRFDVRGEVMEDLALPSADGGSPKGDAAPARAGDAGPTDDHAARASGCSLVASAPQRGLGIDAWALLAACGLAAARARVPVAMRVRPSSEPAGPAPSDPNDVALIERAARGDVDAFAAIYDRHASAVVALLARMLGSEAEARDVLHDVFLEAWRSVRAYDVRRASVRTWLLVRARSRALDRAGKLARAEQARRALAPARRLEHVAHPARSFERQLAVRRALTALDPDVRTALELTYYGGFTAAEIGERTGIPVGTVKSRLARGLAALAATFEGSGESGS